MADPKGRYELMYIINPVLNTEQTKDIVGRVDEYVRSNGGEPLQTEELGSQRLAYPLQKKRNGYYVNVHFRAPAAFLARFDRALRINEDILRHLVVRYDAKMERHYERVQKEGPLAPIAPIGPVLEA